MICTLGQYFIGFRIVDYSNFKLSLVSAMNALLGIVNNELKYIDGYSSFYMIILVFVVYLFLRAGFAAIFVETYRRTMLDYGLIFHKQTEWKNSSGKAEC